MNKIYVTRIIHPIGQGGFYTETLSNGKQTKNFVYDCGGFNGKQDLMEKYLDYYLDQTSGTKEIEAIFISHFHADHINGLQYLLNKAAVKYLFLPQLTEDILIEAFVYNYCKTGTDNQVNRFLLDLYGNDNKEGTRIIQVKEANESRLPEKFNIKEQTNDDLSIRAWNLSQQDNFNLFQQKSISSDTILYCGKWLYIPYNPLVAHEKRIKLRKQLETVFKEKITMNNLPKLLKHNVEKCKEIYNRVFHNQHNGYSMTLFSGTIESELLDHFKKSHYYSLPCTVCCDCSGWMCYCPCGNPNFLYTGDFEPKYNITHLQTYYNLIWKTIFSIQVPHHGSMHNFSKALYKYPRRGIVSVGNKNPYHHPDIDTMAKIQKLDCFPIFVTENKSSIKIYRYES